MKLLMCTECQDIVRLIDSERRCECGRCGGVYVDDINATYFGDTAIPIGISNNSLSSAIINQPEHGNGEIFTAFVIPKNCLTYKKQST